MSDTNPLPSATLLALADAMLLKAVQFYHFNNSSDDAKAHFVRRSSIAHMTAPAPGQEGGVD